MADVFISYKRSDIQIAQRIEAALKDEGFSVFLDVAEKGINAGEAWQKRLDQELAQMRCCIVLTSSSSMRSQSVMREVQAAYTRKVLIPVFIEPQPKVPAEISAAQAVQLIGWKSDRRDPRWRHLVDTGVARMVGRRPVNAPARNDIFLSMVQALTGKADEARMIVEEATRSAILSSRPSEIMTFRLSGGRVIPPGANIDYAKALVLFVAGQSFDGQTLDSALTPRLVKVAEDALRNYLNSETVMRTLMGPIEAAPLETDAPRSRTRSILRNESVWLGRELVAASSNLAGFDMIGGHVTTVAVDHAIGFFMHSAAGAAVLAAISHSVGTMAGKIAVAKVMKVTYAKVLASAATKTVLVGVAKKLGLAAAVKVLVAQVLAVVAPKLVLSKFAVASVVFIVLLPIIGLFIKHDLEKMPEKLANEVPPEVGNEIRKAWPDISQQVCANVLGESVREVISKSGPPKRSNNFVQMIWAAIERLLNWLGVRPKALA